MKFVTRKPGNAHIVVLGHVRFSGMRKKKVPDIAKGPGPGPGPAGLTRGPGPGPAQRSPIVVPDYSTFIQWQYIYPMTRHLTKYYTNILNIIQIFLNLIQIS